MSKFDVGEYVITNTGSGERLGVVVEPWWTTYPHEVRLAFPAGGSRLDLPQDMCRLATDAEKGALLDDRSW